MGGGGGGMWGHMSGPAGTYRNPSSGTTVVCRLEVGRLIDRLYIDIDISLSPSFSSRGSIFVVPMIIELGTPNPYIVLYLGTYSSGIVLQMGTFGEAYSSRSLRE